MVTDGPGPMSRCVSRCGWLAALFTALVLVAALPTIPASGASATACHIRDLTHRGTYRTLPAAVKSARDGDRLLVRGTCIGETTIRKRLTILGQQAGTAGLPTLRGTGTRPVLRVLGRASVKVIGLTIEGRPDRKLGYWGGGVYSDGTVTLEDVIVRGFHTSREGAGIYNDGGTLRLTGTTSVTGNEAYEGGGILNNMGSLTLDGTSAVTGNAADWGGGIANYSGTVTLNGSSSVSANSAAWGGGIVNQGIVVLNDDSTVTGNSASEGAGGIRSISGAVTLNGASSISGNRSDDDGGGVINVGGSVTLNGASTVAANRAAGDGGGIHSSLGIASVTLNDDSTLTANTAGEAGGGIHSAGYLTLEDAASISGNTAGSQGGGVEDVGGTLRGVSCAPAASANVHHNTPDDCGPAVTAAQPPTPRPPSAVVPSARVIELEMTAALQFLQDGEQVRDIPVVPGETVLFRIRNRAGFDHSFYIGTDEELSVPNATTDIGIPVWSRGVRKLTWTVPDDITGLRFGCTVPGHYPFEQGTFSEASALPDGTLVRLGPSPSPDPGQMAVDLQQGGRVEVPWAGLALTFPDSWTVAVAADPDGPPSSSPFVLRADDVEGTGAGCSLSIEEGRGYDRAAAAAASDELLTIGGAGAVRFDEVLPWGSSGTFYASTYVVVSEDATIVLGCSGRERQPDHWLSIAQTLEFLPADAAATTGPVPTPG
jgi:hypothetical protein